MNFWRLSLERLFFCLGHVFEKKRLTAERFHRLRRPYSRLLARVHFSIANDLSVAGFQPEVVLSVFAAADLDLTIALSVLVAHSFSVFEIIV